MVNRCSNLFSDKKYEDALRCYDEALVADPDSPEACIGKAETLMELGRLEEALTWYDRTNIMALEKTAPWGYFKKSLIHYMLGNPDKSLAYLDKVLELDPGYRGAWFNKGVILAEYFEMTQIPERAAEAIRCYDMELEAYPGNEDAVYNKGLVLDLINKRSEALECFDKVIRMRPDRAAAHMNKGNILSSMNKYDDAMTCYDRALQIEPDSASAMYNKSRLLYFLDRIHEAAELLERTVAIDPNLPDLDNLRGMLKDRIEFGKDIHKKVGGKPKD